MQNITAAILSDISLQYLTIKLKMKYKIEFYGKGDISLFYDNLSGHRNVTFEKKKTGRIPTLVSGFRCWLHLKNNYTLIVAYNLKNVL